MSDAESQRYKSTILLPATKTDLAAQLGVRRTSLSRELAAMRADGLVTYDTRRLTLLRLPEEGRRLPDG